MEKFKMYFSIACTSFTFLVISFTILSFWNVTSIVNANTVLILFGMTALVAVLIFLTDKIPVESRLVRLFIDFADVLVVVFGLGIPLEFIPANPVDLLVAFALSLGVFAATYLLMLIKAKKDAELINRQIDSLRAKNIGAKKHEYK